MAPCIPSDGCQRFEAAGGAILGDASDHLERPVDGRREVDVEDLLEPVDRIDARLARHLVDAHGEIVARDAGGRHAHRDRIELAADRIEYRRAERFVGRVAPIGEGDFPAGIRVDAGHDLFDLLAHVDERQRAYVAARQFRRHGTPDAARGARDDCNFSCDFHLASPELLHCNILPFCGAMSPSKLGNFALGLFYDCKRATVAADQAA